MQKECQKAPTEAKFFRNYTVFGNFWTLFQRSDTICGRPHFAQTPAPSPPPAGVRFGCPPAHSPLGCGRLLWMAPIGKEKLYNTTINIIYSYNSKSWLCVSVCLCVCVRLYGLKYFLLGNDSGVILFPQCYRYNIEVFHEKVWKFWEVTWPRNHVIKI